MLEKERRKRHGSGVEKGERDRNTRWERSGGDKIVGRSKKGERIVTWCI